MPRHLLEVDDLTRDEFADLLARAEEPDPPQVLAGKGVGLIFEKASGRTRNATEMAVVALGGHPVSMRGDEVGIDSRETAEDVVRALAGYHAIVGARVKSHNVLERMAAVSPVPVVNLLSDLSHPCQAIADLLTLKARFGDLAGLRVAFVGDFNNVARSLALASAYTGVDFVVASPPAYAPSALDIDRVAALGGAHHRRRQGGRRRQRRRRRVHRRVRLHGPRSRGRSAARSPSKASASPSAVMEAADAHAIFLHCLPAIRGSEVDADVIDGPQSAVFEQAAKRLDAARGALWWLEDNRMRLAKQQRQHRIAQLLESGTVTSQSQLVDLLAEGGVVATQATVSRDLEDMGAVKIRVRGGETAYALPELPTQRVAPEDHLRRVLSEWLVEVAHSGPVVVLRTPPGSAHVVGSAIDRAGLPDVLGTVAGDDTLMVIASAKAGGEKVADMFADLAGL